VINDRKGHTTVDPKKYKLRATLRYILEVEDDDEKMEDGEEEENEDQDDATAQTDQANAVEFQVKILQVGD
jgi:hypothetical protein